MARDVLMERRVAQAGTVQARSTAVDTEAWNAGIEQSIRFARTFCWFAAHDPGFLSSPLPPPPSPHIWLLVQGFYAPMSTPGHERAPSPTDVGACATMGARGQNVLL